MIAVIYGPGNRISLIDASDAIVALNITLRESEPGVQARVLNNTALSGLSSVMDPRLPRTVEAFDQLFPEIGALS